MILAAICTLEDSLISESIEDITYHIRKQLKHIPALERQINGIPLYKHLTGYEIVSDVSENTIKYKYKYIPGKLILKIENKKLFIYLKNINLTISELEEILSKLCLKHIIANYEITTEFKL